MINMIVKQDGVDENNAIIKSDIRDGRYCLMVSKYIADKVEKNEIPDFEEWFSEHNDKIEKLKNDLAKFYEITHLPPQTIDKVYQLAWDLAMEYTDMEDEEESLEALQEIVDRFGELADLFKI